MVSEKKKYKPMSQVEFQALRAEWNKKLKDSGFEDLEWSVNPNSDYLKKPINLMVRRYNQEDEHFFYLCRTFVNEGSFKRKNEKVIFELFSEGLPMREILKQHNKRCKKSRSIFYIWTVIERYRKLMFEHFKRQIALEDSET